MNPAAVRLHPVWTSWQHKAAPPSYQEAAPRVGRAEAEVAVEGGGQGEGATALNGGAGIACVKRQARQRGTMHVLGVLHVPAQVAWQRGGAPHAGRAVGAPPRRRRSKRSQPLSKAHRLTAVGRV